MTSKLIVGILSIVLSVLIMFQSMIAGLGNALSQSGEVSGTAGLFVAIMMLVAGIVGIVQRKTTGIAPIIMYVLGALIGFTSAGSYADLNIWAGVSIIFAIIVFFANRGNKKRLAN